MLIKSLFKRFLSVASIIFFCGVVVRRDSLLPFTLCAFLNLSADKNAKQKENAASSQYKLKKKTFTGRENSREKHHRAVNKKNTLFCFLYLSHKDHAKTFTMSQKSKFLQTFSAEGSGNLNIFGVICTFKVKINYRRRVK